MKNKRFFQLALVAVLFLMQSIVRSQEFPIAVGNDTTFSGGAVFGGVNGLVAVQGDANTQYSINAQLVGAGGQLIGSRISLGAVGITPGAMPVFDGTNYFLVWLEFSRTLKGQFLNTSGGLVGTPITIATDVTFEHLPYRVIFGDSSFIVLFVKTDGYLYGQQVSTVGSLLGSSVQISSNLARDFSVAFDGTNYLVAWVEVISDRDKDIYGQFVSTTGSLVGGNFLIDGGPNYSDNPTSLAFDGTRYLLAYHEMPPTTGKWTLIGQFLTTSGTKQETFTICDSSASPVSPFVSFDHRNYLISWMQGSNGSLMARFFNTSGAPVDVPFVALGPLGNRVPFGGIGFGGDLYLVVATRVDSNFTDGDVYGRFIQPLSAVAEGNDRLPDHPALLQNFPNPFNPTTSIVYDVPERSHVTVTVLDLLGREVAVLVDQQQPAGRYRAVFDATALPSGAYFYRLTAGSYLTTNKMLLLR